MFPPSCRIRRTRCETLQTRRRESLSADHTQARVGDGIARILKSGRSTRRSAPKSCSPIRLALLMFGRQVLLSASHELCEDALSVSRFVKVGAGCKFQPAGLRNSNWMNMIPELKLAHYLLRP